MTSMVPKTSSTCGQADGIIIDCLLDCGKHVARQRAGRIGLAKVLDSALPAVGRRRFAETFALLVLPMSEVTRILSEIERGDPHAAEQLLPLVYDELRKLAAQKLAQEKPGQTLEATALVHEAYVRLVDGNHDQHWDGQAHFFGAAAEAMRRLLIDNARRKQAEKNGGGWQRHDLLDAELAIDSTGDDLFAVDEALSGLATREPVIARLVELRFFAGLTLAEAAACLGISERTAHRHWAYARAWLRREVDRSIGRSHD
jgi:RNA polymerase sigma factor (TIGR02999 family)